MKEEMFKELLESVRQAGAIMRGEMEACRSSEVAVEEKRYEVDPDEHSHWEIDHE